FVTNLYFRNFGNSEERVVLKPYSSTGSAGEDVDFDLQPGELLVASQTELFPGSEPSHFSIQASDAVTVTAGYKIAQGPAATAHVSETGPMGTEFWVYPGESDLVFDGMA